jgi:hypothetical protein
MYEYYRIVTDGEMKMMWNKVATAYFKLLNQHLS